MDFRILFKQVEKDLCERSLYQFTKEAWQIVEPGTKYKDNWHIKLICDHLQACFEGKISKLIINIPPRHMKSLIAGVMFPAWVWTIRPSFRWLFASYAASLSVRDSLKCRRLVASSWYQSKWGDLFKLTGDQNLKSFFENDKTGYRFATSVGSATTGHGGDAIVCLHPDTLIQSNFGNIKIKDIVDLKLDVKILSFNHINGKLSYQKIKRYDNFNGRPSLKLTTKSSTIILTEEHLVYVLGKGYIQAKDVINDDRILYYLQCSNKAQSQSIKESSNLAIETIESIERTATPVRVYNLEIENNHNYFANNILLHNCDDPHNALQATSMKIRESTLEWWDQAMSTRLNNQETGFKILIMQRLHQDDLTGHLLKQGGWEHLCLPAEFEPMRRSVTKIGRDIRTRENQLLWPSHFGKEQLADLKISLGEIGAAGQLQQRPAPIEGGIIKAKWFNLLNVKDNQPYLQFIIQSWDTAYTEKTINDPSACVTLGVFATKNGKRVLLLDAWAKHLSYPDLRQKAWEEVNVEYNGKQKKQIDVILIEDKGSGIALARDLRIGLIPVKTYNPGRADKITRMHIISPLIEAGLLYLPESEIASGTYQSFCKEFVHQLITFPNADHDDLCVVRGTKITMADGKLKNIENIKVGDFVQTPEGACKVIDHKFTGIKPLWELKVGDNNLIATNNHPIGLKDNTFVRIDALTQSSEILCLSKKYYQIQRLKQLYLMVVNIIDTQIVKIVRIKNILQELAIYYIETCGNFIMAKSRQSMIYTILMKIAQIMPYLILPVYHNQYIELCGITGNKNYIYQKKVRPIWKRLGLLLKHGTHPMKEKYGIKNILKNKLLIVKKIICQCYGNCQENNMIKSVYGVILNLKQALKHCFVRLNVKIQSQNIVQKGVAKPLQRTGEVFNITVERMHCYYANNILTHNCDATTQALIYLRDAGLITIDGGKNEDYPQPELKKVNPYMK